MTEELRVLILEDVADDAELMARQLRRSGLAVTTQRTDTRDEFARALDDFRPDVALVDFALPGFDGREALQLVRRAHPEVPVIIVTGSLGDENAIELLKAGARDYVLKDHLMRLGSAVRGALAAEQGIRARKSAEQALRLSEARYRNLFEEAQDGVLVINAATGQIEDVNPYLRSLLGYAHDELVGRHLWEIGVFPDPAADKAALAKLIRTGYIRYDDLPLVTKDGRNIDVEFVSNVYSYGDNRVVQCNIRDITARKQAQAVLRASEEKFRALTENSSDITTLIDRNGVIRYDSPSIRRLLGYEPGELMGLNAFEIVHPDDRARTRAALDAAIADPGVLHIMEHRLRHKDGSWWIYETRARHLPDVPGIRGVVINSRDIGERKRAEEALRANEIRFRALTENSSDITALIDRDGAIRYESPSSERLLGYKPGELLDRNVFEIIHPEDHVRTRAALSVALEAPGTVHMAEHRLRHKDGRWRVFESKGAYLPDVPGIQGVVINSRDITDRREAEAALRASETRFRSLIENSSDMISQLERDGTIRYESPSVARLLGYSAEERTGKNIFELMHPDDVGRVMGIFREALQTPGSVRTLEFRVRHRDGGYRYFESIGRNLLDEPSVAGVVANSRDITDRKLAERTLQKVNRALKTLSACNEALVHAAHEPGLLEQTCRVIVETGGYRLAWVGYAEQGAAGAIKLMAQSAFDNPQQTAHNVTVDKQGLELAEQAIRSGAVQIGKRDESGAAAPQAGVAAKLCQACIALPFHIAGEMPAVLSIHASETDAFDAEEVGLLQELAGDLAFGIMTLRTRAERDRIAYEHRHHDEILRKSLEDSIQAIAATVEMRDPYTAGHQRRVAQLCTAIARELGLPDDRIHGLHLAASIHDLGKVHVPAEILSKPGRLSVLEFELIKTHPQVGHDIIKDVNFPWPIAQMVLQHHEHIDGSGYPNGLKGDAILLESRVLAVADVVEAMMSHRPYRPMLGGDAALEEIRRYRGIWFDPAVVDTCVRLFRDKNFAFA